MKKILLSMLLLAGAMFALQQNVTAQELSVVPTKEVAIQSSASYNPTLSGPTSVSSGGYGVYQLSYLPAGYTARFRVFPSNVMVQQFIFTAAAIQFWSSGQYSVQCEIYDSNDRFVTWRVVYVNVGY